jgi:hypothetical protein
VTQDADGAEVVLLVEDDPGLRRSLVRILELHGYSVLMAEDAHAARELAGRAGHVDLLVTDLVLPGIGGREAANLLQARFPGLAVLFMSGFVARDPELRKLTEAGYPVLRKPFEVPEFLEAVRRALSD